MGKAAVVVTVLVVVYLALYALKLVLYALSRLVPLVWRHAEVALELGIVLAVAALVLATLPVGRR